MSVQLAPLHSHSSSYSIYTDSNVAEVMQCRPVLHRFMIKLKNLLSDWTDNPILIQVTFLFDFSNSKMYIFLPWRQLMFVVCLSS